MTGTELATIDVADAVTRAYVSPLDVDPRTGVYPTSMRGGIVTDPHEVEAIRARVEYGSLPWWHRLTTPRPDGWRGTHTARPSSAAGVTR